MKSFFKEFKEFAIKGNIVDLAVGVVIGSAFSKLISSFVDNIILAPLTFFLGKANFTDYFWTLSGQNYETLEQAKAAGATTLNYGAFVTQLIDFFILALIIFVVVKQINKFRRRRQ